MKIHPYPLRYVFTFASHVFQTVVSVFLPPGRFEKMNSLRAILANLLIIRKAHTYSRKLMDFLNLWGMSTIMEIVGTVLVNLC
jgi:hypothetical protein